MPGNIFRPSFFLLYFAFRSVFFFNLSFSRISLITVIMLSLLLRCLAQITVYYCQHFQFYTAPHHRLWSSIVNTHKSQTQQNRLLNRATWPKTVKETDEKRHTQHHPKPFVIAISSFAECLPFWFSLTFTHFTERTFVFYRSLLSLARSFYLRLSCPLPSSTAKHLSSIT